MIFFGTDFTTKFNSYTECLPKALFGCQACIEIRSGLFWRLAGERSIALESPELSSKTPGRRFPLPGLHYRDNQHSNYGSLLRLRTPESIDGFYNEQNQFSISCRAPTRGMV